MKHVYNSYLRTALLSLFLVLSATTGVLAQACSTAQGDTTVYGTGNIWNGYVFEGMNFQNGYKGWINEGMSTNPGFDENFGNPGGSNNNTFNTNSCTVQTYQFSVRYKLQQTLVPASYVFTVGGD